MSQKVVRHSFSRSRRIDRRMRHAFTTIELLISMILLGSVMTVAVTMIYRADLVWRDTAQQRVAIAELSNQLEELTLLPSEELDERLSALSPSDQCRQTLIEPSLVGRLIKDSLGNRLELELNWQRHHPGKPVRLAGWIGDRSEPRSDASATKEED